MKKKYVRPVIKTYIIIIEEAISNSSARVGFGSGTTDPFAPDLEDYEVLDKENKKFNEY
ncbi:hypothetical protein [Sphingobacterium bovistauri]|uniref:Uncharacterized protein n=1 Tax=Sphingobacterium bovistauri TaxID=2781959 RepID=A0ABS7Z7J6_9SPHI|nr:hypothetical protein [Sphingobacterium bovistauri]MCA5006166.1 hypothetical protein [Sphingobacterium bovistauri]